MCDHYRDDNLTAKQALQAMDRAAEDAMRSVLDARLSLLNAGIASSHPMCRVLDSFAECMADVVRYRRIHDPVEVCKS